jgi:hypothetical protein
MKNPSQLFSVTLLTLTLHIVSTATGCTGGEPGDGDGDGDGDTCATNVVTTDVDAFFSSIACTYAYEAENTRADEDATFTHGESYAIVVDGGARTVTLPADAGPLSFDFAQGGTFDDQTNETNVMISSGGQQLIVQWEKADEDLLFVVGGWHFDSTPPDPLPGPLDANDAHGDLSFAIGTFGGPVNFVSSIDGTPGALPLCTTSVNGSIDTDANMSATLDGATYTIPYTAAQTNFIESEVGTERTTTLSWTTGTGADAVTVTFGFAGAIDGSEAPTLRSLSVMIIDGTFEFDGETYPRSVTYSTVPSDTTTCPG